MKHIRIAYIDRLKGLCILAVIVGHFIIWPLGLDDDYVTSFVTSFHMPIFMFLSGFVISSTPNISKCIRKIPQFIFPMLIVGALLTLFTGHPLKDFIFSSTKSGYWYLWVLSIFYFLLSILSRNSNKSLISHPVREVIFGIIIFALFLFLKLFCPKILSVFFSFDQCFALWPCFFLGFMSRRYSMTNYILKYNWISTIGILAYTLLLIFYATGLKHLYMLVSVASIIPFILLFKKRNNYNTRIEQELAKIGRSSLDIYIYHYFIVNSILLLELGKWLRITRNFFLEGLISLAFSLAIAYLCILIGSIIKEYTLLNKIIYGRLF